MEDVLNLFVLITIGTIVALLIGQFSKDVQAGKGPNAKGGIFQRVNATFQWAIKNAFGG